MGKAPKKKTAKKSATPFTDFMKKICEDKKYRVATSRQVMAVFKDTGLKTRHVKALLSGNHCVIHAEMSLEVADGRTGKHPLNTSGILPAPDPD